MVRSLYLAAAVVISAGAAQAGGLSLCAINGTCGSPASGTGLYVEVNTTTVESMGVSQVGQNGRRLVCPYPHRPSDSVFIGGSGYLTKDQVRRANGCR